MTGECFYHNYSREQIELEGEGEVIGMSDYIRRNCVNLCDGLDEDCILYTQTRRATKTIEDIPK